eukprot:6318065-Alexandrium_andersonii.AAC.1
MGADGARRQSRIRMVGCDQHVSWHVVALFTPPQGSTCVHELTLQYLRWPVATPLRCCSWPQPLQGRLCMA